jgi:hypothetical protein
MGTEIGRQDKARTGVLVFSDYRFELKSCALKLNTKGEAERGEKKRPEYKSNIRI